MKVKLLSKSSPFQVKFGGLCEGKSGLYITFLAFVRKTVEVKQFFYRAQKTEKISCDFSTLLFAKEDDELDILPWRYKGKSNLEGFGTQVISVKNLSHPMLEVKSEQQAFEDAWEIPEE